MAKSNKFARLTKNTPTFVGVTVRDAQHKPNGLYLLELRSHHTEAQSPRRKLTITIDPEHGPEALPKVVKITHT